MGALTLLTVHGLAVRWREVLMRQGFVSAWLAFAGFAVGAAALGWVLTAVLVFRLLPVGPALFQALLAAALYPALAIPLHPRTPHRCRPGARLMRRDSHRTAASSPVARC